ncbi:TldD/PmbA family protein [Amylibacter sp. IMCC11727]|uniref:TldD/PmbA family protein n=1 Tax=Amylibacter sp. IMCC11727 TaxID=3039851 RepID=UPI00244DDFF4|nr:TldD/PmbA family protein [Amylibacter sp. IMCC11727]WGI22267.1 TldD/PmbA family protein [Amylibacter sp. IMCC11727]
MTQLADLAQRVLDAANAAGADAADTLIAKGTSVSIEVREGALEHAERSEGIDLGLRVLMGARQACVSISDDSATSIAMMAERAVAMAKEAPEDPTCGLAEPDQLAQNWDVDALELFDGGEAPKAEELQQMAIEAEAAALAVDGVSKVQASGSGFSDTSLFLAATNGFQGGYRRGSYSTSCVAISGEGLTMERDYHGEARSHLTDLPSATEIGRLAGERAVERAGATRPPTGAYPVLFDERIAASLVGHLAGAVNGSAIVRGASYLKDSLGEQVLPKGMSLIENPSRPRVAGSRPFDGEGLPVAERAIVKDGILQGWTLDLATARKLGMESTGNASRGVSSPPSPSTGNLTLTQGDQSREDLIAMMGTGLVITSMIGSTINPNTGDYSRGAAGFWVENGEVIGPVNECTVAGNLLDILKNITPANDARQHLSRVVPSLLVEGLTIAGA